MHSSLFCFFVCFFFFRVRYADHPLRHSFSSPFFYFYSFFFWLLNSKNKKQKTKKGVGKAKLAVVFFISFHVWLCCVSYCTMHVRILYILPKEDGGLISSERNRIFVSFNPIVKTFLFFIWFILNQKKKQTKTFELRLVQTWSKERMEWQATLFLPIRYSRRSIFWGRLEKKQMFRTHTVHHHLVWIDLTWSHFDVAPFRPSCRRLSSRQRCQLSWLKMDEGPPFLFIYLF